MRELKLDALKGPMTRARFARKRTEGNPLPQRDLLYEKNSQHIRSEGRKANEESKQAHDSIIMVGIMNRYL